MSTIEVTYYNVVTGEILQSGTCQARDVDKQVTNTENVAYISGLYSSRLFYIDTIDFLPKSKTEMLLTVRPSQFSGKFLFLIEGVPLGASVTWPDDFVEEVNDATIEFEVDLEGQYILHFSAIKHLDKELIIETLAAT